ncbi:MAG: glycoside hydrolase 43 family protein [Lachnospiraceae bacterium]|nr:glycoside hydrolase 43 family protein [Lachnospiraceae bacterium]
MNEPKLWCPDLGNGTFQNPILYADYSDPDVCRVGDTFYMTASSFNYIPGLPILVSKDLVNWELKNYAIKERIPYTQYDSPAHAKGIWAPSIRYHNGEFYIFVGMPDEGIFMLKTKDPLGEWSEPCLVLPGKGYIDPCPLWDDDGNAYVIHGYAKSRIGFKSILGIFQITPDDEHAISDDVFLYDGTKTNPTIEGPKVYKRNGYYYIFAPAGGVKTGWQTVLRSKNLYGPYEEKVVMHQGSSDINGPHQGGLVDTPSGEEWFIHFQDAGVYGRITHMQPVVWKNDWPVIGLDVEGIDCGEPQHSYPVPDCHSAPVEPLYLKASDDFSSPELGLQWQWLANSKPEFYSLTERPGVLRLYSINPTGKPNPVLWDCANVLTQKLVCPAFTADFDLDISGLQKNCRAGIVMIGGEYSALAFHKSADGLTLEYFESETVKETAQVKDTKIKESKIEKIAYSTIVDVSISTATLRISFDKNKLCRMSYRLEGETEFKDIPFTSTPKDHTWVGAKTGIFSTNLESCGNHGFTDFLRVTVSMN